MAQIIGICNDGSECTTFVDALSQNPKRFEQIIVSYLKDKNVELVVKNYMDESIPVVSAASIVAKVERDKVIADLKKKVGVDFGVGYPHDKRTTDFVEGIIKNKKEIPTFVRRSWITTQNMIERNWQKKIKDFFVRKEPCKEEAK